MSNKDLEKLHKFYMSMVTSNQFSSPPVTRTKASLDWLVFSIAIEEALGITDE